MSAESVILEVMLPVRVSTASPAVPGSTITVLLKLPVPSAFVAATW